jgi:hypothetical protein
MPTCKVSYIGANVSDTKSFTLSKIRLRNWGPFLTWPLGANFDPRGEVVPQGRGEHYPRGKISPLGTKFTPRGEVYPWGPVVKLRMALCFLNRGSCLREKINRGKL